MMRPCDTGVHQRWSFEPTRATQQPTFQRVRNVAWGMCLDADNRGGRLTRFVNVFQCNDSPNQAWAFPEPGNQGIVCVLVAPACDLKLLQTTTAAPACLTGPEATALCSLAHVSRNRVNGMADDHTGPEFLAPYTVTLDGIGVFYSVNDETWFVWPATVRN